MTNTQDLIRLAALLKEALRILEAHAIPAPKTHGSPDAQAFIDKAGISRDPKHSTKFRDFYTLYTTWCTNTGFQPASKQLIGAQLAHLGYTKGHRSWGKQIIGMRLPEALTSSLPALDLSTKPAS